MHAQRTRAGHLAGHEKDRLIRAIAPARRLTGVKDSQTGFAMVAQVAIGTPPGHCTTSMRTALTQGSPNDAADLSQQGSALLERARALHAAARRRPLSGLLAGKNVGLLCDAQNDADANVVEAAAAALGAHVALVRPNFSARGSAADIQQAARLLGRLYDVLACVGLTSAQVHGLKGAVGIPVFEWPAAPNPAAAGLVDPLDLDTADDAKRTLIIQAALLIAVT